MGLGIRLAAMAALAALVLMAQSAAPQAELQEAQRLAAAGRLEEALALQARLLRSYPSDARVLVSAAVIEFKAERYRDASGHAEQALRLQPGSFVASLFRGASLLKLGRPGPAEPHLRAAVAAQPGDRNARLMLAEALLALDRQGEAAREFEAVAPLLPDSPRVWFGLFAARFGSNEPGATQQAMDARARLERLPESPERHQAAALEAEARGRRREAAAAWQRAAALAPGDPQIRRRLVLALYQANDAPAGLALLEQPLREEPASAEWNFLAGAGWLNLQESERAIGFLRQAVVSDPELLPAQAALGQALLQAGRAAEAIPHLRKALKDDPDGTRHYQLARALQAAGRAEEAGQVLRRYEALRAGRQP